MTVMRKMLLLCAFVAVMEQTTYEAEAHPWRYIFPFFPEELDILLGHLGTTVLRLEDVLETCKEMSDDDFEADDDDDDNNNNVDINNNSVASIGVQSLSAGPKPSPNLSVEKKVEWIHDLREKVKKLEDDIEECRYKFWTGQES